MNIKVILNRFFCGTKTYLLNKNNERDYKVWIFGEWFGKKCSDNVMTFANYVAQNGDRSLELFWICNCGVDTSALNKRITVVDRDSRKAIALQKKAGVAVMNQGFDDFSNNGENYLGNAITVNLWHGVMWKKIGFDSYPDNMFTKFYVHLLKRTKQYAMFCSPSKRYTDYFAHAFGLDTSKAIMAGLPRNELFFYSDRIKESKVKILEHIKALGIDADKNLKIITYMPTFRDGTIKAFSFSTFNQTELNTLLKTNNCIIIQKAHEKNISRGVGYGSGYERRIINLDNIPPQELLAASDILVTDYSSCLFDFLLLDRPIIQFVYDYEYYSKRDRGLYYSWEKIDCGYVIQNEEKLLPAMEDCIKHPGKYHNNRLKVLNEFMTYESRGNSKIIYDAILNKLY